MEGVLYAVVREDLVAEASLVSGSFGAKSRGAKAVKRQFQLTPRNEMSKSKSQPIQ